MGPFIVSLFVFCVNQVGWSPWYRGTRTHSRSNMPALWINAHPAKRREASRSGGIPSDCEGEDSSCGGVARGFARSEPILGPYTDTGAKWRQQLQFSAVLLAVWQG